ncbi:MAG: hypothetical protein KKD63_08475 [Proteobacteria bacterium]|nr:hypothetical protein [Desulfobulbaceae bacterium]MBU4152901.1 hypothetical protein [Pseudomonadota bacterium]
MITGKTKNTWLVWSAAFAYGLIGIEIVIMISPFALYFYSVYGPILEFFSAHPALSWLTEFFLPHMVFLDDPLVLGISYLQILLVVGMALFFFAAIPLYYGRFTGKGVVRFSFYSKIRHPQYLFLAISGFGLLLYWPRFIILILYITMLFVYYLLARNEEWRMLLEAPGGYADYMKSTPMFFPGEPGDKIYQALFAWIRPKWLSVLVVYLLSMALAMVIAMAIRQYAVNQLPIVVRQNLVLLPVFPASVEKVTSIYQALEASPQVRAVMADQKPNLAYIFPGDYFLTAIVTDQDRRFSDDMIKRFPEVLEWHQNKFRGGLGEFFKIFYNFFKTLGTIETDYEIERIVLIRVGDELGEPVAGGTVFAMGLKRTPVMIVDLDAEDHHVVSVIKVSGGHKWGSMPMPTF